MSPWRRQLIELLIVPTVMEALAAGFLVGFANLGAGPQVGTITTRTLVDGEMVARIEAPAAYSGLDRQVVVVEVILPIEYHTATTIPVRVLSDGSVEIAETRFRMPWSRALDRFCRFGGIGRAGDYVQSAWVWVHPGYGRAGNHAALGSRRGPGFLLAVVIRLCGPGWPGV